MASVIVCLMCKLGDRNRFLTRFVYRAYIMYMHELSAIKHSEKIYLVQFHMHYIWISFELFILACRYFVVLRVLCMKPTDIRVVITLPSQVFQRKSVIVEVATKTLKLVMLVHDSSRHNWNFHTLTYRLYIQFRNMYIFGKYTKWKKIMEIYQ